MTTRRRQVRDEWGAALVFVVLLMLAFVGLGHGLLVTALAEVAASTAAVRHLAAETAADAAVSAARREPPGPWIDSVPAGGVHVFAPLALGRAEAIATLHRLGPESWLVGGRGRVGLGAAQRSALLAWSIDPFTRVAALGGVLNAQAGAGWTLDGTVDVSAPVTADSPPEAADCAPWLASLDARYAGAPLSITGVVADTVGGPGLGLLDFAALLAAAEVVVAGVGTPTPVEALGQCVVDAPWGWGDPDRPWRPCGPYLPLRASLGDLTVEGGAGQGMLVVDGDLTLGSGARYQGLVVANGLLRLEGGASLEGLGIALAGAHVEASARVRASACWAVRALAAQTTTLRRLIPPRGVGPIGPL